MSNLTHLKWLSRRGYSALVKSSISHSIGRRKSATKPAGPSDLHSSAQAEGNVVVFKPRSQSNDDDMIERRQAN